MPVVVLYCRHAAIILSALDCCIKLFLQPGPCFFVLPMVLYRPTSLVSYVLGHFVFEVFLSLFFVCDPAMLSDECPLQSYDEENEDEHHDRIVRVRITEQPFCAQHHLVHQLLQHLLVNFYLARRLRHRHSPTPPLILTRTRTNALGGSRSAGTVALDSTTLYINSCKLRVPTTQLAKMSIDLKFVKLTADVLEN